jgi:TPR repeat protein
MNNLDRAANPNLSVVEFKELLDLQEIEVYQALDLNEQASQRYIAYLETQPDPQYFPEEDFNGETLQKANAGDHLAQFLMALDCQDSGDQEGVKQWFRKSAENGNIIAAFNYALNLSTPSEQLPWLYRAAFKGLPEAQREVGRISYDQGDSTTARMWFGLAMRRGNPMAFNDMGIIYWDEGNSEVAVDYWRQGAELGDENAISNLEMSTSSSLFDDDFEIDFIGDNNETTNPPYTYQPPPLKVEESTKRTCFEIF